MTTIKVRGRSDAAGNLHLEVPVGTGDVECEVLVRVDPPKAPSEWLPGFWETLYEGAEKGGDIVIDTRDHPEDRVTSP